MKIRLICVGKTDFSFVEEGVGLYASRLKHYCRFEETYIPALKGASSLSRQQIKDREGELILKELGVQKGKAPGKKVVLLDERGDSLGSEAWAARLEKEADRELCFVIGGAYGFSQAVYDVADSMLSLSKMTFSHQIVRLIFMEQLYRAMTIIKGEPYHHA